MEHIRTISGDSQFIDYLVGHQVKFHLVGAYTKTCEIEGISSAGLPGMLHYTPPADMEALYFGKAACLPAMPEAPTGPPSPVILALAVKQFFDMSFSFVDAGLRTKSSTPVLDLGVPETNSILDGAEIQVERLLEAGRKYADSVQNDDVLDIVAECVPGGTTTAYSLCKSLGYQCDHMFSGSSIEPKHSFYKRDKVDEAIAKFGQFDDPLKNCQYYGDNMQPFVAAAVAKMSQIKPVVMAGGTQMLAVYALMKKMELAANFKNIAVVTTRWVADDKNSDFKGLASLIDPEINTFCSDFIMDSKIPNLSLYEQGMVKEGVGAGALLAYALGNGVDSKAILQEVESIYLELFGRGK